MEENGTDIQLPLVPKPEKRKRKTYPRKKKIEREVQIASRTKYELIDKDNNIIVLLDPFPVWSPSGGDIIKHKGRLYEVKRAMFDTDSPTIVIGADEMEVK
jgi:hypothetical protein